MVSSAWETLGLDALEPDYGPPSQPTSGATLVTARPEAVAFNVKLEGDLVRG